MTIATSTRLRPSFTIGDRLRKARGLLESGDDVKTFAELIGVGKNTVTNYELERTSPENMKPIVLRQWALATGVDYEWLVYGDSAPHPGGGGEGADQDELESPLSDSNRRPPLYKSGALAN